VLPTHPVLTQVAAALALCLLLSWASRRSRRRAPGAEVPEGAPPGVDWAAVFGTGPTRRPGAR
jgi:hypothetical protein